MSRRGAAKPYTSVQGHHESSIVIVTIETQRRQSALDGSLGYTPGCLGGSSCAPEAVQPLSLGHPCNVMTQCCLGLCTL